MQREAQIQGIGRRLFAAAGKETPSVFDKARWTGKALEWCMRDEQFKVQLFRFVDVFPCLTTRDQLTRHIDEYFEHLPAALQWGAKMFTGAVRNQIEELARQFIIGETTQEAVASLNKLHEQGLRHTLDLLGEATVSEKEADHYLQTNLDLVRALHAAQTEVHISVKPTALFSQVRPADFAGAVRGILQRLRQLYAEVIRHSGFLCIDMESYRFKDTTLEVYRQLRADAEFRDHARLGLAMQTYLRDTERDVATLLEWSRTNRLPISLRLVKGAYWDYETVIAQQHGWPIPVFTQKAETDAAFERIGANILQHHDLCHLACGSHNIRSIAAVLATARELRVPDDRCEFQLLSGMAEPIRAALQSETGRVRLYCPYGPLLPGIAYLVRRLLENTSNESFLRQSFVEAADIDRLLEAPRIVETARARPTGLRRADPLRSRDLPRRCAGTAGSAARACPEGFRGNALAAAECRDCGTQPRPATQAGAPFRNEPAVDFTRADVRAAFPTAIATVRSQLGRTYPLFIGGREVTTDDTEATCNPANPSEIIGHVCQAARQDVDRAVAAAKEAFPAWRDLPAKTRAQFLTKAAGLARQRIDELAAWQILEVGKQWEQACADVTEAIDFLEFYAQEMLRLAEPQRVGRVPGELNHTLSEPLGVAAVIAPWNFPLAISCGMCAAALVTGNTAVYKPSDKSAVVGHTLLELFRAAGLPNGVFNFLPGRGREMGDSLVEHPEVSLIAFTGSVAVGRRIMEKAAVVQPGQTHVKRVIAEMGGKNAIIIDDDADLDEAVPGVLSSAFGYQGQKCSACSRVIVLDAIYERFISRLVDAAGSLPIGPAEDPANFMGPVVDEAQQKTCLEYIAIGKREGQLLYGSPRLAGGWHVPLTIIGGITPAHRLAQEEIFGPVLAVMRVTDFAEALEWANTTPFALTGGVYSRSPRNLARARREFRVGNLYLNRQITGALVERQPFGGFKLSGTGTKAGGHDYLLHFLNPRAITENTLRRGFAADSDGSG